MAKSFNKPLETLTFDGEFVHEKTIKDLKKKPKGFKDGIQKGVKSLGSSIISGAEGLVTKPVEAARDYGFEGLIYGVLNGAMGAFFKPASGAVDLIAKTTQGYEAQLIGWAQCPIKFQRYRQPRAFYGEEKLIKPFNELDALAYRVFNEIRANDKKKRKIQFMPGPCQLKGCDPNVKDFFVAAYKVSAPPNEESKGDVLALTSNYVFTFEAGSVCSQNEILGKCLWKVESQFVYVDDTIRKSIQKQTPQFFVVAQPSPLLELRIDVPTKTSKAGYQKVNFILESGSLLDETISNFNTTCQLARLNSD